MKKIFPMKSLSNAQQLGPTEEEDRAISTTMSAPTFSAPTPTVVEEDETDTASAASAASESAYSQSSYSATASEYSASEYASDTYTDEEDEVSYGDCLSTGGDSCNSLDSVERVLIRKFESAELVVQIEPHFGVKTVKSYKTVTAMVQVVILMMIFATILGTMIL